MAKNFRKTFELLNKNAIHWFPGHMGRGMRQMEQQLKNVDLVIEVHDARIPVSGRNPDFKYTVSGLKPHILVLNKKDLAERRYFGRVADKIRNEEGISTVLFTNCKDPQCDGVKRLLPKARELIVNSNRFNRTTERDYNVMVIGVPNVGKSSLLNVMRNKHLHKKNAAAVGSVAGITRSVLHKIKICEDPLVYMIDTPGILTPKIGDVVTGMKLALCGCLPDHLVGEDLIADFLLFWLNSNQNFTYVEEFGIPEPTDQIMEVLLVIANKLNKSIKFRNHQADIVVRPDILAGAHHFIKLFRSGQFGNCNLDQNLFIT